MLLQGCGPSFEAIQEGDLRFAHCDRLDMDSNIAASHRLHCWREWRRVYTYGQTRDRVEYAQRRIAEVVSGDIDPPFDLPSGEVRDSRTKPPPAAPSVPAAPVEAAAAPTSEVARAPELPAQCRARCATEHEACAPGCETLPTGCQPCESTFEGCIEQCGLNSQ